MNGKWLRTIFLLGSAGLFTSGTILADYTVTGIFQYEDREQDRQGFTGTINDLPIRSADVEVVDDQTSDLLATGFTDSTGTFSIDVVDAQTRDVVILVKTTSDYVPTLQLKVGDWNADVPYALESQVYTNHDPGAAIEMGTVIGTWDAAGQPFNFYDSMFNVIHFTNAFEGGDQGSYRLLDGRWTDNANGSQAFYNGRIMIGDAVIYDDTVIQHETGHWVNSHFSNDSNPGGTHYINLCSEDSRLAYGEGIASWYSNATRLYYGLTPQPQVHVVTTGQPGAGQLDFSYEVEGPTYYCQGPEHEITVNGVLWDMLDGADTPDDTPGIDDDPMNADLADMWDVILNYMRYMSYPITLEEYWDGWFARGLGMEPEMIEVWGYWDMEYYPDDLEPDNNIATASSMTLADRYQHHTFYPMNDEDWTQLPIIENATLRVQARNIIPETVPEITIYDSDGVTEIGSNSDNVVNPIIFTPTGPGPYYAKSMQKDDYQVYTDYGNFDLEFAVSEAPPESANIEVSPALLMEVGAIGDTLTDSLVIFNAGGGPLHYTIADKERFGDNPSDLQWMTEDPDTGMIVAGDSALISVIFATADLAADSTYDALIVISSNDMVDPEEEVIVRLTTQEPDGTGNDEAATATLPRAFSLGQNYPNPFNPSTSIRYDVPADQKDGVDVTLEVFNVRGQRVALLVDREQEPGSYLVHWNGRDEGGRSVGSGVYIYRLKAGSFTSIRKMVIMK